MKRKKLRPDLEAQVLTRSRRRCAICFGLKRDTALKDGQIAHIDKNSTNDRPDNLVYLCLEHHNQYDSITSQSKNLTKNEVLKFQDELVEAITRFLSQPAIFGVEEITIAGRYIRTSGPEESAELDVESISSDRIKVTGLALFGLNRDFGPNIGELDFEVDLQNDVAFYAVDNGSVQYSADIHFTQGGLILRERYSIGMFGMGVSFDGVYRQVV